MKCIRNRPQFRKVIILITCLLVFYYGSAAKEINTNPDSTLLNKSGTSLTNVTIPDKLNIVLPEKYFEQKSDTLKDYFPAILTLIAGVISVLMNWLIAKRLRESTAANIERQLDEAKRIKYLELQATINTKNRQEWMNQFRDAISEYISLIAIAITNIKVDNTKVLDTIGRLSELQSKLDLLLHPERENEKEIIDSYAKLFDLILTPVSKRPINHSDELLQAKVKLIDLSRAVLEKNWQKLNNLDYLKRSE